MKTRKLKLEDLKVKSFVTAQDADRLKGGAESNPICYTSINCSYDDACLSAQVFCRHTVVDCQVSKAACKLTIQVC